MKVIDLTAPRRELRVRIDPSPAYDFLACLFLLRRDRASPEFDIPARWIAQARTALGSELRADLRIPMNSSTDSGVIRPPIPIEIVHPFRRIPARLSERQRRRGSASPPCR